MKKIGCFAKMKMKPTLASVLYIVANLCVAIPSCADEALGLVLSGGGAKGAYEVGVWQELVEQGLDKQIKAISGTSVGAINAALFAAVADTNICDRVWQKEIGPIFQFNTNLFVKVLGVEGVHKVNLAYDSVRKNIQDDCASEAMRRRCAVSDLPADLVAEISKRCESVARKKLFLQLPKMRTMANMLVDFDESKPIDGFLSSSVLHSCVMRGLPCVWRDDAPAVYVTALKKQRGTSFSVVRFSLVRENPERRASMICASACIPLIFGMYEFEGETYVDGGWEVKGGDNVPIAPILGDYASIKTVIAVYLDDATHISSEQRNRVNSAAGLKGVKVVEVIPSENINGLFGYGVFDTSVETVRKLIALGRKDARETLKVAGLTK